MRMDNQKSAGVDGGNGTCKRMTELRVPSGEGFSTLLTTLD